MMELGDVQAPLLKQVVDAVRDVVQEANIEFSTTSGFSLLAMDSSFLALAAFLLRPDAFQHFRCDRPLTMAVNLNKMATVLRCAATDDIVKLRSDDEPNLLTFIFESPTQHIISEFGMSVMVVRHDPFFISEDIVYNATVKMPSSEFSRIIKGLSSIGDTVFISVTQQGVVKFTTKADFVANITCTGNNIVERAEEDTMIEMNEPVSQAFSLRYLNSFTKATRLSSTVTIGLSMGMPLMVEYKIAEKGYVRFYLAPKIEEEEEEEVDVQNEEQNPQD
ncbi:unnamed protein product [Sphenostylis stenocarpa]|uniref:DNA sliding clamp PCNA n=1 Tax=Sphenostylis stenocarpa TaxID=92480 RepID=A0AA86SS35_9FABA|nr:unnamed protein product [Sphenostylis stenocarpa]